MATTSLNNTGVIVSTSNDSIVIVENFESYRGGRSLDVTGFPKDVINAGHVIIKSTANGDFKPMPLNTGGTAYAALPANHVYVGFTTISMLTKKASSPIMVRGTVNPVAAPFDLATIQAAVLAAVPGVYYRAD